MNLGLVQCGRGLVLSVRPPRFVFKLRLNR
jgi:hypothetical protein